jgi:AcrR family transcriptional regulator
MVTSSSPPRRNRRREETERRIIEAAIALLQKRPVAEITVEEITEAADVAKGTFFNYFSSKEQVTLAAARLKREEFVAMTRAAADVEDVRGFLRDFTHGFLDQPKRTPTLIRNILGGALGTNATVFPFQSMMLTFRAGLTAIMRNGQKRGQIRRDIPAEKLAAAFQQCLFGTQAIWAIEPHPDDIHQRIDLILEIFWQGVAPKSDTSGHKNQGKRALI